jgi:hypothetical protein
MFRRTHRRPALEKSAQKSPATHYQTLLLFLAMIDHPTVAAKVHADLGLEAFAPGAERAVAEVILTGTASPSFASDEIDHDHNPYAACALAPNARAAAARAAAIFEAETTRAADNGDRQLAFRRSERLRANAICAEIRQRQERPTAEDAINTLIPWQTERRFGPLFASQLEWGARAGREGSTPIRTILKEINRAAEIALGIKPFDIDETRSVP